MKSAHSGPRALKVSIIGAVKRLELVDVINFVHDGAFGYLVAGSLPYPLTFDEPFPYRLEYPPADLEEIPVPLQNVLLRCLAEDPEERLPHAGALVSQLRQARELMHGVAKKSVRLAAGKTPAPLAASGSGGAAVEKSLGAQPAPRPKGQRCGPESLKHPQAAAPAPAVGGGPGRPDGGSHHLRGQGRLPAGVEASTRPGGGAGGSPAGGRGAAPDGDRRGRGPRGPAPAAGPAAGPASGPVQPPGGSPPGVQRPAISPGGRHLPHHEAG